jgi:hypothetical protein
MSKSVSAKNPKYSNKDIAVIALYSCGGALRHVHLEDVAIRAAQLLPRTFSWKKYPEQINLEAVRLALKGGLSSTDKRVTGGIKDGWMLTPKGLTWCMKNSELGRDQGLLNQIRKEVGRARKTSAFAKTSRNKIREVSIAEVESLLRTNEYSTPRNRKERAMALANAAVLDSQLMSVLAALRQQGFSQLEVIK